jgi:maltooligosyltrehalose trehalohydrolase
MGRFSVWAPDASTLELVTEDGRRAMSRDADGWWSAVVDGAGPGTDYGFSVNCGKPVPDPRSPWQPAGVHELSRTVDHRAFQWTDSGWQAPPLSSAIIYELHIGTFTPKGTFESAIKRLDYLADLGITHVELMPVNEFSGDWGWGYDGVQIYAPHHSYGGPEGLKRFVEACHQRGLAVLLDVVYNHLGPTGNYLGMYGPYFTDRYSTPWGSAVNFDGPGSPEVRRFFVDNALMWLRDYHFDGLRLDAIHAILDQSATHFLEELANDVRALEAHTGRRKVLIAESDLNDPRVVRVPEVGGYGVDAQWSDDFHHAIHSALTGEASGYYADFACGARGIAKALNDTFVYDGRFAPHRGRTHGRSAVDVSSHRFLGYSQTHDQVGNRAQGERLAHLTNPERAKMAAALVLTSPFIPMLFQGEEWGASTPFQYFTHHQEEELARAVSEGRRREFASFGWKPEDIPDPQDPATFQRSKLDWTEPSAPIHREIEGWYRKLIKLRRTYADLTAPRNANFEATVNDGLLSIQRGRLRILANLSNQTHSVAAQHSEILLASPAECEILAGSLTLPPDATVILIDRSQRS